MYEIRICDSGQRSTMKFPARKKNALALVRREAAKLRERLPHVRMYIFDSVAYRKYGNGCVEYV